MNSTLPRQITVYLDISLGRLMKYFLQSIFCIALWSLAVDLFAAPDWPKKSWFHLYPPELQRKLIENPDIEPLLDKSLVTRWDEFLSTQASRDRIILSGLKKELTVKEVDNESRNIAAYLQHQFRDSANKHVAVMMPSSPELYVTLLGIFRAGFVPVVVLTAGEKEHLANKLGQQLYTSKPAVLIGMNTHASVMQQGIKEAERLSAEEPSQTGISYSFSDLPVITSGLFDSDESTGLGAAATRVVVSMAARAVGRTQAPPENSVSLKKVIDAGKALKYQPVESNPEDTALMQFTSGTTGNPKAIKISYGELEANLLQVADILSSRFEDIEEPSMWQPLPMTHAFGMMVSLGLPPVLNASVHLVTNPKDKNELLSTLEKSKPDAMFGVDKLLAGLSTHTKGESQAAMGRKVPSLILAGASKIKQSTRDSVKDTFGIDITEGYGMSESTVGIAIELEPGKGMVPLPWIDLIIAKIPEDNDSRLEGTDLRKYEQPAGEEGELFVSGPNISSGYFDNEEATKATFITDIYGQKWLRTGDLVIQNSDGYLSISGRTKEVIIVSGQNVNPEKLEGIVQKLEGVEEVMAFGMPVNLAYPAGDERVAMVVRPKKSFRINRENLEQYMQNSGMLEQYEIPRKHLIRIVGENEQLPINPLLKPMRCLLKQQARARMVQDFGPDHNVDLHPEDVSYSLQMMSLSERK